MKYVILAILSCLQMYVSKNVNVLTAPLPPQKVILQQQTTLQMSSLSLMGSVAANMPAYLELVSMPLGVAKILIDSTDTVEGSALRWIFNDQVVLSMSPKQISTQAEVFNVNNLKYGGSLYFGNSPQWKLVVQEQFWQTPLGWTDNSITTCGGINMLGGFGKFAGGEVKKTFTEIPPHNRLRIVSSYHFIDSWSGESGFMRANIGRDGAMEYLWTEKYDFSKGKNGINVCGASYPEGKLTSPIDITIPHISDKFVLGFGSTLDQDPEENSFGVSNIQIYIC